jgi:hypothetical protein
MMIDLIELLNVNIGKLKGVVAGVVILQCDFSAGCYSG